MKLSLLNECELCGRRWAPSPIEAAMAPIAAALIKAQTIAPPGCQVCNPEPWNKIRPPFSTPDEENRQRLAGEGYAAIDGRDRERWGIDDVADNRQRG